MLPRRISLPKEGNLPTEEVVPGLFVVKDAYASKPDYFATSTLYAARRPAECEPERQSDDDAVIKHA